MKREVTIPDNVDCDVTVKVRNGVQEVITTYPKAKVEDEPKRTSKKPT